MSADKVDEVVVCGGTGDGDDGRVEVLPSLGGRLHRWRVFGHDLLRTPTDLSEHRIAETMWGSYPMVPWCNRLPGGSFTFDGRTAALPATFPGGHAIHGLLHSAPWSAAGDGVLEATGGGDDAYPWPFVARQRLAVDGPSLTLTVSVENTGPSPMPAGLGIHPWFDASSTLEVSVPVTARYEAVAEVPVGQSIPVAAGATTDLRPLRTPVWGLDGVWTGLTGHTIALHWPERGIDVDLTFSETCDHVVFASFEHLAAFAIEPQTHATDGHRRLRDGEEGAIGVLGPGETLSVTYTLTARRAASA